MFDTNFRNFNIRRGMPERAPTVPLLLIVSLIALIGCDHKAQAPSANTTKPPTVASLVPSASDLIIAMGAGDHLVAVSNYDREPAAANLPRVGDYQTIDWEKIAQLHPKLIITYYGPGHIPAGFTERTSELQVQNLNLTFNRLTDVFEAIGTLGVAIGEPAQASALARRLTDALESTRARTATLPRPRALIVTDPSGLDFAGRNTYLDDLLNVAGGRNAIETPGYLSLDREAVAALKPDVVLQLLPGGDAAGKRSAMMFWNAFADLPAVKDHRVYVFTEPYMMTPGVHVTDVAKRFANALHPGQEPASRPTTNNSTP